MWGFLQLHSAKGILWRVGALWLRTILVSKGSAHQETSCCSCWTVSYQGSNHEGHSLLPPKTISWWRNPQNYSACCCSRLVAAILPTVPLVVTSSPLRIFSSTLTDFCGLPHNDLHDYPVSLCLVSHPMFFVSPWIFITRYTFCHFVSLSMGGVSCWTPQSVGIIVIENSLVNFVKFTFAIFHFAPFPNFVGPKNDRQWKNDTCSLMQLLIFDLNRNHDFLKCLSGALI